MYAQLPRLLTFELWFDVVEMGLEAKMLAYAQLKRLPSRAARSAGKVPNRAEQCG
jgi:hypothetical protein